MGRNEEAEEVLRNALIRTGNGRLHLEWARLLTAKGETDVARQHVRSAFASEDVPLQEKAEITWTYIELSELQPELQTETGQLIDLLLEAYPNDAAPFELQAAFLDIQGRPLEALEALGEALDRDPNAADRWLEACQLAISTKHLPTLGYILWLLL